MSSKKLRNRRLIHGIPKTALAKKLGCSYAWIDRIDRGLYSGPARESWEKKYERALERLIQERGRR